MERPRVAVSSLSAPAAADRLLSHASRLQVFRMGVDWGRVVPTLPRVNHTSNSTDWAALKRYREIAQVSSE